MHSMKVMTVLGTRPEIIRLSRIIPLLDASCSHVLVHSGQNHDRQLRDVFFEELGVRQPDHPLNIRGTVGAQLSELFATGEQLLHSEKPDRLLVLGDTNTGLIAILAKRMGVPVVHMEAGNRCFNDEVPEEVNRRLIDHASDVLLPYTEGGRRNLIAEGISPRRVFVTGNPIHEVIAHYESAIRASPILERLNLAAGQYFLATLHRAENVDSPERLRNFLSAFEQLGRLHRLPVVVSTHPRTRDRISKLGELHSPERVQFHSPFGFFDFLHLERHAKCVLSDSGTVQEECAILGVPSVTLRHETERPETLECGSNTLTGDDPQAILAAVERSLRGPRSHRVPPEYNWPAVSQAVVQITLGCLPR